MTEVFGGSDAEGLWLWKEAYEATEIAQVLFPANSARSYPEPGRPKRS
ncbi:hypothetical protein ACOJBO_03655 [Rhizobium beringeri]